ncbi:hypothetical protein JCM21900_000871 [Sporobolomyces salmonicolor]
MLSHCRLCARPLLRPFTVARLAPSAPSPSPSPSVSYVLPFPPSFSSSSSLRSLYTSSHAARPYLSRRLLLHPNAATHRRGISVVAQPPPEPSEDFEPVEAELTEGETLEMALTDAAIKQIERAQQLAKDTNLALRLTVESGGCHGYQYKMLVTSHREADDYLFAPSGTTAKMLVDSASLPLVKGSEIDYATELIGSAFKVKGNPQSKDAGCGCGVSWELKDL